MTERIDQKDINNAAWSACDTFRGVVDPAQYKDYILVVRKNKTKAAYTFPQNQWPQ